jgi:hypothetical protein
MSWTGLLSPLMAFGSWLVSYLGGRLATLFGSGLLAYFGVSTDWGQWALIKLFNLLFSLLEYFISFVSSTGLLPEISFSDLPQDVLLVLAYLQLPACFSIIFTAYAIRITRKFGLRK